MGDLNIPPDQKNALRAIDTLALRKLIEECLSGERPAALQGLRLEVCGLYVASKLGGFERALADYSKAKTAKKRAETECRARRAGSDLVHAVEQMKDRVEAEEREGQFFYVEDRILPPDRFSERLSVQVGYRWRRAVEDQWIHGSIGFLHNVESRPDYITPSSKRKPSASKREQDRQDELYRTWEYLKSLALYSVREYFREGRDGSMIPKTFQARIDSYSRGLNNFSAKFWTSES